MTISFSQRVSVPKDVLINVLGGESVLLNLQTERYYGLDEVGTRVWSALTESDSIQSAYDTLLAEYEVEPERLRRDVTELVEKLVEQGLIEMK